MNNEDIEIVRSKYLRTLIFPTSKPEKQIFFCPVGLVGAGKTTFTQPISEKLNFVRISSDEVRKILKESGFGYGKLKEIIFPIIIDIINKGWSVSFDMDCGNPETKSLLEKLSLENNIKIIWVHINSPEDYIINKFKNHPPTWLADNPQIMIDNYHTQKEKRLIKNNKFNFCYIFDASKNVEKQVENFLKFYEKQK